MARVLWHALPRAYAIVFFSSSARFGWLLVAVAWLASPLLGAAGTLAVLAAAMLVRGFGARPAAIGNGYLLFNPMLAACGAVLLARSHGYGWGITALLWAGAVVSALALTLALQGWFSPRSGLSVLSLPAVITVYGLHFAVVALAQPLAPVLAGAAVPSVWPPALESLLQAFAAMVFSNSPWIGLAILGGLALVSPLGALMAVAGFAAGAMALGLLGIPTTPASLGWCSYNFLLTGIALGAGYHVPNRSSLALAVVGSMMAALLALGLSAALGLFQILPGAMPFNFAVIALVAGLRRLPCPGLTVSPWSMLLPEAAARQAQLDALRFPHLREPALLPPFEGERVVTQGFGGNLTHRGAWRHGIDFEAPGGDGSWGAGSGSLAACRIYDTAVLAPCAGTVAGVVNHVPDNPLGGNNPQENWGNHVILRDDFGHHVMLAHLRPESSKVAIGQYVLARTELGRCGNSGRSPVPHLHVHVQESPFAGAPTRPWVMKHFVEAGPGATPPRYRLSGVPEAGTRVRAPAPDEGLHSCFSGWLPGERMFHWSLGGHEGESRVRMVFDEAGRFRLESHGGRAWLLLFLSEGVLYAHERGGARDPALDLIALALARVPCIAEPEVVWTEQSAAAPWMRPLPRAFHAALDPFIGVRTLEYQYRVRPGGGEAFALSATLLGKPPAARLAPASFVAHLGPREALVALEGESADGTPLRLLRVPATD